MPDAEKVILVDEHDRPVGEAEKLEAHSGSGALHRAISVFVMSPKGELLLQRRAHEKYHFAGLWSNTCCTHPRPGESTAAAARRRLREEMGVDCDLEEAFSFTYEARSLNGLIEKEFDHVFLGTYAGPIRFDPHEVAEFRWVDVASLAQEMAAEPERFTPWFGIALDRVIEHRTKAHRPANAD